VAVITTRDDLGADDADRNDMNIARPPQPRGGRHREDRPTGGGLDDATVEGVLQGDRLQDPTAAALRRVLDAAAAPATQDELRHGEAVFAAYAARTHTRRRPAVLFGRRLGRLLGLKVAVVIAAATTAGGLAWAASTGVLPTPLHPRPTQSHASASPHPVRSSAAASPKPSPIASVARTIAALCTAYQATNPSQREKMVATPGFAPLVAAAGSADKVSAYCAATVARTAAPHATPSRHPTGKPTAHPTPPVVPDRQPAPSPDRQTR
jgi:hypothetical protein